MDFILTILFSALLWSTPAAGEKDYAVIIIDDCENWESIDGDWWPNVNKNELNRFLIRKIWDNNSNLYVAASHLWNYFIGTGRPTEIDKATKKMTYQELLDSSPMYSSEMSYLDWRQISRKHFDLVYVLRPEDYCKEGGIDTGKQITVYQVNLTFPESSNCIIDP
jgi:hypothetical protein